MANDYSFTSHDGIDESGVRAEVKVRKGTLKVKNIELSKSGSVAKVIFDHEGKFPIAGWINVDEEAYKIALNAKDANVTVDYRIESQRRKGVDRTVPFETLRKGWDGKESGELLTAKLVMVDGVHTSEILTNPHEDKPNPNVAPSAFTQEPAPSANVQPESQVFVSDSLATARKLRDDFSPLSKVLEEVAKFEEGVVLTEDKNVKAIVSLSADISSVCGVIAQRFPGSSSKNVYFEVLMTARNVLYSLMDAGLIKITPELLFGDSEVRRAFKNNTYATLQEWLSAGSDQ